MKKRPHILTIAGFDPSGGAGILADIKTIESLGGVGMAVQTANTIQTEDAFMSVNWVDENQIMEQLLALLDRYVFDGVKIGLIPSLEFLGRIIPLVSLNNNKAQVIWDPVLSASAGFDFEQNLSGLNAAVKLVDWITPNWHEAQRLGGNENALEGMQELGRSTHVYLKGGHNEKDKGKDYLIAQGVIKGFNAKKGRYFEKHGSGCVFSTALAVHLAKGYPKQKAILRSKRYVEFFLKSTPTLLGGHK